MASGHPFTAHLVAVLSIYELGPGRSVRGLPARSSLSSRSRACSVPPALAPLSPPPVEYLGAAPLPRYDGPRDWQTDAVERALGRVAARMYAAEAQLQALTAGDAPTPDLELSPRTNGTRKRRENPPKEVRFEEEVDPDTPIAKPRVHPGTPPPRQFGGVSISRVIDCRRPVRPVFDLVKRLGPVDSG